MGTATTGGAGASAEMPKDDSGTASEAVAGGNSNGTGLGTGSIAIKSDRALHVFAVISHSARPPQSVVDTPGCCARLGSQRDLQVADTSFNIDGNLPLDGCHLWLPVS
jgi:hypothetical protein